MVDWISYVAVLGMTLMLFVILVLGVKALFRRKITPPEFDEDVISQHEVPNAEREEMAVGIMNLISATKRAAAKKAADQAWNRRVRELDEKRKAEYERQREANRLQTKFGDGAGTLFGAKGDNSSR